MPTETDIRSISTVTRLCGREWSSAHDLLVVAFEVLATVGFLEDFVWGLGPDEGGAIEVVPAGIHPLSYSPLRHTVSP
jgi:hypothetical protein